MDTAAIGPDLVDTEDTDQMDAEPIDMEQVAVVGLAGRFPGATTIQQFWQNLCNGVEARTVFSEEELTATVGADLAQYPGYVKSGFILEEIDQFDADFFRFDPQQARITDPQQRLFLECVWEALETAGIDITTYPGLVGVYAGASQSNYWIHARIGAAGPAGNVLAVLTGNDKDYLATQTAYRLNLQGPCMSVQSACSTGLVAVHLACQSLLNQECDVAVAGGVTVHIPQRAGYLHDAESIFSTDGRSCAFSNQATGMAFGNGIGVVVLKRLSDALADGDPIWAVVRGSAVNNDGSRKFGFMTSSRMGQIEVITEAWGVAGVTAHDLSYIETHGSATPIGDVVEFSALATLFADVEQNRKSCAIGSVKNNVGHLETAAGITGLIKTVLALHHRQLPPLVNYTTANADIHFDGTPLYVNTTLQPWEPNRALGQQTRCAGVSSFGIGGTNAHVVLEEAPPPVTRKSAAPALTNQPPYLLTLSAKNQAGLQALAQRYVTFLGTTTEALADICYTAQLGRSHFAQRISLVATSAAEAQAKLSAFVHGANGHPASLSTGTAAAQPKIAFRFEGNATHYPDWGRSLYATQPVFHKAIDQCLAVAAADLQASMRAVLSGQAQQPPASHCQPYLFALDYAVARLWQAWGITTQAVIGQGVGDYVAACLAGVFSLADAVKLVTAHSQALANQNGQSHAVAAQLTYRAPTIPLLSTHSGRVLGAEVAQATYWQASLATARNDQPATQAIQETLAAQGIHTSLPMQGDWARLVESLGALYVAGAVIDWGAFYQSGRAARRKVLLPTYPFQRQRYWVDLPEERPAQAPVTTAPAASAPADQPAPSHLPTVMSAPVAQPVGNPEAHSSIRQQLLAAPKADQYDLVVAYLQRMVAALLAEAETPLGTPGVRPTIGLTVGFAEVGMTSLNAITMRNHLQSELAQKLPAALLFDYPTIATLATYLLENIVPHLRSDRTAAVTEPPAALPSVQAEPTAPAATDIDALTTDDIAEMLATKLGVKI